MIGVERLDESTTEGHALGANRRAVMTIITNFVARIASFGLIAFASRLAIEGMGIVHFGIWMTIAGLVAFLSLLDFGIGNGLIGPIAQCSETESDKQARLVTMGIASTSVIGFVFGLCFAIIASIIPMSWLFRGIADSDVGYARDALLTFAVLLGVSLPLQTVNRIFVALQRAYLTHALSVGASLAMAGILIFTVESDLTVADYVLITFGALQIPGLISLCVLVVERKFRAHILRSIPIFEYRSLLNVGSVYLALQVGTLVGWGSDQILVSVLRGPAEAGSFAIAIRIFMLVSMPLIIANGPLWPIYANAIARGDLRTVNTYFRRSMIGSLFSAIILCITVLVAGPSIWDLFSGGGISYNFILMLGFAVWTVIDCTGNALGMFLNGVHIVRPQLVIVFVFAAVSIPTKIYMLSKYDIWTIPFVTAAIYLLTIFIVYKCFLRRAILRTLQPNVRL